ncbi:D-aminoacyl-tRNA deacylase [bacterium]|jgi:D-tyrosyl-tRNA(Tyr) deacylase|nr:D-aminoacyl-tRNA deacylase [bacterium]MDA9881445.1 D-aminoacyl-tRNA deacylase [Crocinitomicaceae bacterium]MDG1037274.1 D-aminoacyl-tRNA deacylase [Crocinitomicaceae bacterium]
MRLLVQRTTEASVSINGTVHNSIEKGLVIFLGIETGDTEEDCNWLIQKISKLRIFNNEDGKMNHSIKEVNGAFLVISQFTLHASTKKGNRPSYIRAAPPEIAIPLYEQFITKLESTGSQVSTGIFGADMKVRLTNDGPVTIWIDSKNRE